MKDTIEVRQMLMDSWKELEQVFQATPLLKEDDDALNSMYSTTQNPISAGNNCKLKGSIRTFGSEPYLQCQLFAILARRLSCENWPHVVISAEGKKRINKRPDLLIWDTKADFANWRDGIWPDTGQDHCLAQIELKVTGYDLINENTKWDHFYKEMINYRDDSSISAGNTQFLFGCYYEGNPKDITKILDKYRKLINFMESTRGLEVSDTFKANLIEAYGFQGSEKWILS